MMRFQRRQRTTFSKQQLDALNEAFRQTNYPEAHFRDHLAKTTDLDPKRIQVWFQNQRAKYRKRKSPLDDSISREHSPTQSTARRFNTFDSSSIDSFEACQNHDPNFNRTDAFQPTFVYVFNSITANEAATAVSEGKCESIVAYHKRKYQNDYALQSYHSLEAR